MGKREPGDAMKLGRARRGCNVVGDPWVAGSQSDLGMTASIFRRRDAGPGWVQGAFVAVARFEGDEGDGDDAETRASGRATGTIRTTLFAVEFECLAKATKDGRASGGVRAVEGRPLPLSLSVLLAGRN